MNNKSGREELYRSILNFLNHAACELVRSNEINTIVFDQDNMPILSPTCTYSEQNKYPFIHQLSLIKMMSSRLYPHYTLVTVPVQPDGTSCGLFSIRYLTHMHRNIKTIFTKVNIENKLNCLAQVSEFEINKTEIKSWRQHRVRLVVNFGVIVITITTIFTTGRTEF